MVSRSRGIPAWDVAAVLRPFGFAVAGAAEGGNHGIARLAWVEYDD
jgi:predicted trehalose synthase